MTDSSKEKIDEILKSTIVFAINDDGNDQEPITTGDVSEDYIERPRQAIQSLIDSAVKDVQLESDRSIFKLLHKFADEVVEDYSNYSGKDNIPTITGRYAMKIRNAVNAGLSNTKEEADEL